MKLKNTFFILIFAVAICCAAVLGVFGAAKGEARADGLVLALDRIIAQTESGSEIEINERTWASGIKLYYRCDYPYLRLFMSGNTGWSETTDYIMPENGEYVFSIPPEQEGMITISAAAYNEHKVEKGERIITEVYEDHSKPVEPDIDRVALDTYHIIDFSLRYRIYKDNFSGVNFSASWLGFMGEDAASSIEPQSLAVLIQPGRRDLDNLITIKSNGILTLYLEDNAGNHAEYTYTYSKHGIPENGAPQVVRDTDEFAKSVTVTINWGAGYDDNPYAEKSYAIVTPSGTLPYEYRGPIEITTEGQVQILIYYYENGEKKYLTRIVDNVDKTPPILSIMQSTASISCNVMDEKPIVFSLKAMDMRSGIRRVYFKTGGDFTKLENGYYSAPITDIYSFTVVAEDFAGNKSEYLYNNNYFDFDTLKAANEKFLAADRAHYTWEGWAAVESACNALSMALMDDLVQTSDIAVLARAIDTALAGAITVTNKIGGIPAGLDGGIVCHLDPDATDALKGETITIRFDSAKSGELAAKAGSESGFALRKTYAFSLWLTGESADVTLTGSMRFDMPFPVGATDVKLYVDDNGTLVEITKEVKDGRVYASTTVMGDMYLVAQRDSSEGLAIFGKTYSWTVLGVTAAIIVGVCVFGFVVTYLIMKRRRG